MHQECTLKTNSWERFFVSKDFPTFNILPTPANCTTEAQQISSSLIFFVIHVQNLHPPQPKQQSLLGEGEGNGCWTAGVLRKFGFLSRACVTMFNSYQNGWWLWLVAGGWWLVFYSTNSVWGPKPADTSHQPPAAQTPAPSTLATRHPAT